MLDLERLTMPGHPLKLVSDVTLSDKGRQSGPQPDNGGNADGVSGIGHSGPRPQGYVGLRHPTSVNESLNNQWRNLSAPIRASAGERSVTLTTLLVKALGNHPERWGDVKAVTSLAFHYAAHFDRSTGHALHRRGSQESGCVGG